MSDVTRILTAVEQGDPHAAAELLPLVYDELRRLAATKMAGQPPEKTLQATALVHEAYLRLVDGAGDQPWSGRGHFFAAAAEAMRRILIDQARRRRSLKRGGGLRRQELAESHLAAPEVGDHVLEVDQALTRLREHDPQAAELVTLKYFGGMTLREAAAHLGIPPRTADELWAYSRAWLLREIGQPD